MMVKTKFFGRILHTLAILIVTFIFLLPLYWMITGAFGEVGTAAPKTVIWWPDALHWENFATILDLVPMLDYATNSLLIVIVAVPVSIVMASWAGFGIALSAEKIERHLFTIGLIFLLVPGTAIWLFRFQIFRWIGLIDTRWALIVPAFAAGSPLFVLLYYWSFRQIPTDIYDAAEIDGASLLRTWWRVAFPLVQPTTIAVLVLSFVLFWGDFIAPVLYLRQPKLYTLPVGLQILKQMDSTNWPLMMGAALMMTLPVLLIFIGLQRYFLHDVSLRRLIKT